MEKPSRAAKRMARSARSGSSSKVVRAGKAPPNPRSYPKAHSLWYAASKGRFAGENPGLSHVELRKVMQEAWPTVA